MGIDLEGFIKELQQLIRYARECGVDTEDLVGALDAESSKTYGGEYDPS